MTHSTRWPQLDAAILSNMPGTGEPIRSGTLIACVQARYPTDCPSRDTVLRALERLEQQGLVEKRGISRDRVWLRTGKTAPSELARRPPLELAVALMTLRRHAPHHLPSDLASGLEAYFEGAERVLSESPVDPLLTQARAWPAKTVRVEVGYPLVSPPVSPDILNAIRRALYSGQVLDITYQNSRRDTSSPTSYKAVPLGLVERGPVLYLVVTRRGRSGTFRYYHLRLDRFLHAVCTNLPGETDPAFDLDEYVRKSEYFSFFPDGRIRLELRVREEEDIRHLFREQWLAPDQQIIEEPGGFRLIATVMRSVALRNLLMERCARVEVLAPLDLREQIAQNVLEAARLYGLELAAPLGVQNRETSASAVGHG